MGVCATHAKGADSRPSGRFLWLPLCELVIYVEGAVSKIELRVWLSKMQSRGQKFMAKNVCCIDQPGHAGRDVQVPNVGLSSPDRAELFSSGFCAESLCECR